MSEAGLFTLGIEEEFQIIDPATGDLRSHVQHLIEDEHTLQDQLKPELHQSVIEVGTNICRDIKEARTEVDTVMAKVDMLVHIHLAAQDQVSVFVNDGTKFRVPNRNDTIQQ